jgi:hypothetical protein
MYKLLNIDINGITENYIIRDNGNNNFTSFPADPNNINYQAYLAWVEQGNTPLPADEVTA